MAGPGHGPGGRPPKGVKMKPQIENPGKVFKRLMSYVFQKYKWHYIIVIVLICIGVLASVQGTLFQKSLIDDYIKPMLLSDKPDFTPLWDAMMRVAGFYLIGVISTFAHNRIMVNVTQGVLRDMRNDIFTHMEKLPIKYFDTHSHGDVMSYYTNDADALRQMLSQSIPQVIQSVLTIVFVFISMLIQSIWLTAFVLVFTFFMMKLLGVITGKSGHFFMEAQRSIGGMNGYIEEMINGQKVVKVFNHEEKAKEAFDVKNGELCYNATNANKFANTLMPLMNGLGYFLYVIIAIIGGYLALSGLPNLTLFGMGTLTLGTIASFLQLSRSFCQPIGNVSNQINSVVMAVAGAKRIFEFIDEPIEENNGKVTLVNMTKKNGVIEETEERTEQWAWKIPHEDGTFEYRELQGGVRLEHVDFSYTEGKRVLHDVSFYAEPGQKVALVGATGAGKTTITNLINHFYDIENGSITYDGINIRDINKDDLRRSMGVVLQDVNLFTGTVMENLRYGRPDATD